MKELGSLRSLWHTADFKLEVSHEPVWEDFYRAEVLWHHVDGKILSETGWGRTQERAQAQAMLKLAQLQLKANKD